MVLVKCEDIAHWISKKLLKNFQKEKKLQPKFLKLLPKFPPTFVYCMFNEKLCFLWLFTIIANISQEKQPQSYSHIVIDQQQ